VSLRKALRTPLALFREGIKVRVIVSRARGAHAACAIPRAASDSLREGISNHLRSLTASRCALGRLSRSSGRGVESRRNVRATDSAKSRSAMLRLYGFRLSPDQPAVYSRYQAVFGTFSTLFDVNFCFGGGLQKIEENDKSLTLMGCGCGSRRRGMPNNSVSHTNGGCGDGRNQVKNAAVVRLPPV
jgi:hypothetical protein